MKTESEISRLNQKINRLEQQVKAQEKFLKDKKRREWNKRLINIGAMAQYHFELHENSLDEIKEIFVQFSEYVRFNKQEKHKK